MPKGLAILITGLVLGACLIFLWALSGQNPGYSSTYLLLMMITLLIGIPARKILTGETPWWSPHAFVLGTLAVYFVVASTAVVHFRVESMAFGRALSPHELNAGLSVVAVATATYLLGFRFGPKPAMFSPRIEWFFTDTPSVQVRFNLVAMTVFLVGIAAWIAVFAAAGGVGAHLQNIANRQESIARAGGIALHLNKWAFVGFFLYFARNGVRPTTLVMFGALMLIYLIYGSRNWVGMFLAGTAIIYRIRFGKIPSIVWLGSAVGLVFVQSFLVLLRYTSGDIGRAKFMYSRNMRTTEGTVLSFVGDFAFIRYLSDLAVSMGTEVPYQWGKTFLAFFYVVPSFLWNPHDYLATGPDVYMRYLTPEHIKTVSVGPSIMGEFVMNFGWPGVVIIPALLGMLLRWFQSAAMTHPHRKYQIAFPVMVAIVGPEMLSFIKHGFLDTTLIPYLLLPLMIPYLPNLSYLTSGPPRIAGAPA